MANGRWRIARARDWPSAIRHQPSDPPLSFLQAPVQRLQLVLNHFDVHLSYIGFRARRYILTSFPNSARAGLPSGRSCQTKLFAIFGIETALRSDVPQPSK